MLQLDTGNNKRSIKNARILWKNNSIGNKLKRKMNVKEPTTEERRQEYLKSVIIGPKENARCMGT
jgi:hypothetical protein